MNKDRNAQEDDSVRGARVNAVSRGTQTAAVSSRGNANFTPEETLSHVSDFVSDFTASELAEFLGCTESVDDLVRGMKEQFAHSDSDVVETVVRGRYSAGD